MFVRKYLASSHEPPNRIIFIMNVHSSSLTLCAIFVLIGLFIPSSCSRPPVNVAVYKPRAHFVLSVVLGSQVYKLFSHRTFRHGAWGSVVVKALRY